VSKLLGKLAEAGLLKPPPSKPATPPEARAGPPPGLPGILWKLTQARPLQCKTCGARFGEEQREELRVHMDWHFRRNMRGKASGAPPPSRRWLLPLSDWIAHEFSEAEGAEADQAQPSAFDAFGEAAPPAETKEVAKVPILRAPSDVSRLSCFQCGEPVEMFFDDTTSEWMLRDAARATDGTDRIGHAACVV